MRNLMCRLNILHPWLYTMMPSFSRTRRCKHCGKTQIISVFEGRDYWFTTGWNPPGEKAS